MKDSKYIDHTLLKAVSTEEQILKLCEEAVLYDFKSVCVNPTWVSLASEVLHKTGVLVCTVVGFPLGANTSEVKAFETKDAINKGAQEIDMVLNIGALKEGNYDLVKEALLKCGRQDLIGFGKECLIRPPGGHRPSGEYRGENRNKKSGKPVATKAGKPAAVKKEEKPTKPAKRKAGWAKPKAAKAGKPNSKKAANRGK